MKKKLFTGLVTGLFMLGISATANAATVGTFGNINNWVTNASRLAGTGGEFAGVDPLSALVGDDLTDGAINIGLGGTDSFLLEFSSGILNMSGDDFVVFDGRFSSDGIHLQINGVEREILNSEFSDSGLNFTLKNTSHNFALFGASLDLSDWGVADNDVVTNMVLTAYYDGTREADIMGVGAAPVPIPATVLLFGTGLVGLAGTRIRRKKK